MRAADGHHSRRPRIVCRRLTLITRERVFFSKCELAHTSQKFRGILSTVSGSAKKWRRAVESNQMDKFQRTKDMEESLGYYVDLRFVGIEWG